MWFDWDPIGSNWFRMNSTLRFEWFHTKLINELHRLPIRFFSPLLEFESNLTQSEIRNVSISDQLSLFGFWCLSLTVFEEQIGWFQPGKQFQILTIGLKIDLSKFRPIFFFCSRQSFKSTFLCYLIDLIPRAVKTRAIIKFWLIDWSVNIKSIQIWLDLITNCQKSLNQTNFSPANSETGIGWINLWQFRWLFERIESKSENWAPLSDGFNSCYRFSSSICRLLKYQAFWIIVLSDIQAPIPKMQDQWFTTNDLLNRPSGYLGVPSITSEDANPTKRYKYVRCMTDVFWDIWKRKYLQSLMTRSKWKNQQRNLQTEDPIHLLDRRPSECFGTQRLWNSS